MIEQIVARDIGFGREPGEGIARGAGLLRGIAKRAFFSERDSACTAARSATAAVDERIGQEREELAHGIEGRLL